MTSSSRCIRSFAISVLLLGTAISSPAFAGSINGSVADSTGTRALQSAQVRIVELNRVASTTRDGSFIFGDVPAGTYTLEARYVGVGTETQTIKVPEAEAASVKFAMGGINALDILVLGQVATQTSSLSRKREGDGISDVLTRDAVGQFPDQNVAEALRRLPGLNILNDQGEGRFVSVRGLDPELNSTSLNGVRLPAPESDVRSVALDVISSDIIESIEVKKSLTPDMDADTIGASIEINTTSAFDRKKDLFTVKAEGSYNEYADHVSPKGSADFSYRLSDNLGVAGGLSYYKRKFETDNIEFADWAEEGGIIYAEAAEYRDYDVERERISASLSFDLKASDTTEFYVRGLYSQFDDQEFRRRTTLEMSEAPTSGDATSAFFDDADGRIQVERDIKDRFETQKIRSVSVGGKTDTGEWKANYGASWAKSSERENGSFDPTNFRRRFDGDGVSVLFDYSDPRVPLFSVQSGAALFNDPAEYELNEIELTRLSDSRDEEYALHFDLGREFAMDGGALTVQAGAKARWRTKQYDANFELYEDPTGNFALDDVLGTQTYRLLDMGPVANFSGARDYFNDNFADFELQEDASAFASAVSDYRADEDVMAAYLLGRWDSSTLRVVGGIRYEKTKTDLFGSIVDEDGPTVTPVSFENDYDQWLPSVNIRFEPQRNLVLRAAAYRSLVRPKLSKMAPRFEINEDDEVVFGNPRLKPYEAWNFDGSAEYYFSSNGALSAGVFYKDIKNFIVDTVIEGPGVLNGVAFTEGEIAINGPSAEVFGLELGYAQAFNFLPAPLDGLLVNLNYTYTDATGLVPIDGDINDLRRIMLPASSKHTFNAVLGYEKGPFSFRLAGSYRDKYIDELAAAAEEDRIVDNHFQLDASAKFRITPNVQLFWEWVNINNAKYFAYNNFGGRRNNLQYEEYNWTMKFGAKAQF